MRILKSALIIVVTLILFIMPMIFLFDGDTYSSWWMVIGSYVFVGIIYFRMYLFYRDKEYNSWILLDIPSVKSTKEEHGFILYKFDDTFNDECTLQKSSSVHDNICLGLTDPDIRCLHHIADELGINHENKKEGWVKYQLPKGVESFSRVHLDRPVALWLANKLKRFANTGEI